MPSKFPLRHGSIIQDTEASLNFTFTGGSEDRKCMWTHAQMKSILKNEVYIGTMVHNKQSTVSFKNKKLKRKKSSEWIRAENTHEPIISREDF